MTTIIIRRSKDGKYKSFTCMGHAGYKKLFFQKDLVCAAVSVLSITTVNSLEELAGEKMDITANEADGFIQCSFLNPISQQGCLLMDSFVLGLRGIESQYSSKYFELKFEEV